MNSSLPNPEPRAQDVKIDNEELVVQLVDGRTVSIPLVWFPRLLHADSRKRENWQLLGNGEGIHWPDLDEDLSITGLLRGTAAPGAEPGVAA